YGRAARATGFAVDVEAIAQGEQAQGRSDGLPRRGVLIAGEGERPYVLATALRRLGVRAAVDPGARAANELAGYADAIGAKAVLVLDGSSAKLYAGGAPRPIAAALLKDTPALVKALGLVETQRKGTADGGRDHRRRPVG